jgi:hypothetical protein
MSTFFIWGMYIKVGGGEKFQSVNRDIFSGRFVFAVAKQGQEMYRRAKHMSGKHAYLSIVCSYCMHG